MDAILRAWDRAFRSHHKLTLVFLALVGLVFWPFLIYVVGGFITMLVLANEDQRLGNEPRPWR